MSQPTSPARIWSIIRNVGIVALSLVAIVVLVMWLMGVFRPRIGPGEIPHTGRPLGDTTLVAVERIRVPQEESAVGTIQAVHETSLGSKLLAKVTAVHVKAGQAVTQSMLLVELDDADLNARRQQAAAAVEAARAKRDQTKIEYDRVQRLIQQGAATRLEQDQVANLLKGAEANLQQAEQALSEADTILTYAKIRSPLNGVVVDKKVEVGDTVQPGQIMVKLYDPSHMQIVARVRESLAQRLQVGKLIPVRIDALDLQCHGVISEIVPEAESASRTFSVKVTGPCPPGVYGGMFGRLMIPLDEMEMLVIPPEAVHRIGQMTTVEVAEKGFLHRRAVQLGRTVNGKVQVLSGLKEGEQVAVPAPATQAATKGA